MAAPTVGTAQIADVSLHYAVWGSRGPWLTLVHGGMMPGHGWAEQARRLASGARVVVFDQRGYGASTKPADGFSIARRAADLLGLWDALGVEHSVLVGFSMGGFVAVETAVAAPHRVAGLLLAGTAAGLSQVHRDAFRARAGEIDEVGIGAGLDAATARVFGPAFREANPDVLAAYRDVVADGDSRCIAASFRSLADFDRRADVARIGCPTIVVHGEQDEAMPPEYGMDLHNRIPGSRLEVFAGAGHTVHVEDPDRFERLVRELVAGAAEASLANPGGPRQPATSRALRGRPAR